MANLKTKRVFYSYYDNKEDKRLSGEIDLHLKFGTEKEARKIYRGAVSERWKRIGYFGDFSSLKFEYME